MNQKLKHIVTFFSSFAFLVHLVLAQPAFTEYPNDYLSKEFHASRRAALRELMPNNSVAVFFAAPVRVRSNDVNYIYAQDPNFYYLSGLTEPNSLLLIFKNTTTIAGQAGNEFIFVQPKNYEQELWTGKILGVDGTKKKLGFSNVFPNNAFDTLPINFRSLNFIYSIPPKDLSSEISSRKGNLVNLVNQFNSKIEFSKKNLRYSELTTWMVELRAIKQPEEIVLMQKAIDISCRGHIELIRSVTPGTTEYEAQAVMEYYFKQGGAEYTGYPSIIGGGENTCTLHYEKNTKTVLQNELLLFDCGAEYHGYSADITRTIPVNGKFSEAQRTIYQLVLDAQLAGINACKPGADFHAPHRAAQAVIGKGLVMLGIIKNEAEQKKYFMHGTSHYLGLNVHDPGTYGKLEVGNVLTVEPGIYIPNGSDCNKKWWNIGVRIEDDVLIIPEGYRIMSNQVPKTIDAIENLMTEQSFFKK